jgi:hypothetical protein
LCPISQHRLVAIHSSNWCTVGACERPECRSVGAVRCGNNDCQR